MFLDMLILAIRTHIRVQTNLFNVFANLRVSARGRINEVASLNLVNLRYLCELSIASVQGVQLQNLTTCRMSQIALVTNRTL